MTFARVAIVSRSVANLDRHVSEYCLDSAGKARECTLQTLKHARCVHVYVCVCLFLLHSLIGVQQFILTPRKFKIYEN